ncbi:glycogen/starch synthase [Candidatus Kapabacteria bacterium]|nr:glycogen/starch synthase [Candidatus Kapabacteria bacterium]
MNIVTAAFEVSPFAKTGGLADVTQALPLEWTKQGHNAITILPKHRGINVDEFGFKKTFLTLNVPMGFSTEFAGVWEGKFPNSDSKVYLIEHEAYFNRDGIYGNPDSYFDNDRRFIFFSRAIFETIKALEITPDIISAHDYHTAYTMAFLRSYYKHEERFSKTAGVFTIHNLAYQGKYDPWRVMDFSGFGMKEFYPGSWFEKDGVVNCMKTGIMFADKITTVSPNYAQEIRQPYYSEGLHGVLNQRGGDLIGILNGVFYDEWNPKTDEKINIKFSSDNLDQKRANKFSFLGSQGLTNNDDLDLPLVCMVTRLTEQKGIDIIRERLDNLIGDKKFRFAILGSGQQNYVEYFNYLKWKYPRNAIVNIGYDEWYAHNLIAASDFLLIPSRFEPCGLTQMYGLKYGTIPIVRSTGGLADTVDEYIPEKKVGTGFVFNNYSADDFEFAMSRALDTYYSAEHLNQIRLNAMAQDNSSVKQAIEYIKVFGWALEKFNK